MNKNTIQILIAMSLIMGGYFIYNNESIKKNEFDNVDKENAKLILIFNNELSKEVERYKTGWYPGAIPTAYTRIENFFKSVQQIETHTKYGFSSSKNHNGIEIKVTYTNGNVVDNIYTGERWNGPILIGPSMLIKMQFENGKLSKMYTNGVEMKEGPEDAKIQLHNLIENLINYDMQQNRDLYFRPIKTQSDLDAEWNLVK